MMKTDEEEKIGPLLQDLNVIIIRGGSRFFVYLLFVGKIVLMSNRSKSALDLSFSASRIVQMLEGSCGYTSL